MQEPVSAEIAEPPLDCADDAPKNLYPVVPEYLRKVYWWAYLHPTGVRIFERQWLVNLILWGNFVRLRNSALDEMGTVIDGRTLQVACVYGDFTEKLAMRLAPGANLDVVDVTPIQLQNLNQKIGSRRGIRWWYCSYCTNCLWKSVKRPSARLSGLSGPGGKWFSSTTTDRGAGIRTAISCR